MIVIFLLCSCEKFLEIDAPVDETVSETVFDSKKTIESSVVGLYSQMSSSNNYAMNGFLSVYSGLSADELRNTSGTANVEQFRTNELMNSNALLLNNLWRAYYAYIYHSKAVLEGLQTTKAVTEEEKQPFMGEMLFVRAISYFYLVNLFGDVPLILSTDYESNRRLKRTETAKIYQQVTSDLLLAEKYLPADYPSSEKIRPNLFVAKALLARIYLFTGQYDKAKSKADEVIGSGLYELEKQLDFVFLPTSKEAIWQLYPTNTSYNSSEGFTFIPSSTTARPAYMLTESLLQAFENGDKRKENWSGTRKIGNISYTYPFKYKVRSGTDKTEYNTVLRLAELYLIRAEANAQTGNIHEAIKDVNVIRTRAGLENLAENLSKEECLSAVTQEKRIEFFAEWGHRWLDLKRTASADVVLGSLKDSWQSSDALYPIPQTEITKNPFLIQNPNY
ncbi:RagB/SusD family nutrient uptake outer membrane protein [Chryseobacterium artocarpi]|uniref:RagB/SusD family nutrient uptake outer membrane protein n=1 Tax=Chryseobacterium artocarpi TaxID=1414727 RepID=UPI0013F4E9E3|nr:RagB/SusD family nutrient uptake outer membrane protein [Chryseobacterium artocarpi]